jgi:transcriptional regulator with XRE-family HTH domain
MAERDDPGIIGRRVQQLRTERGLTQKQLAEPAYTPAYVSTLEAGRVRPSEEALRHIAERLGVAYEELATGRPAHLATDLRLRLTDAQRTLATGEAEVAAEQYTALLAEAESHGLNAECAAALLGLGECALDTGDLGDGPAAFRGVGEAARGRPAARPGPGPARPGGLALPRGRTPVLLLPVGIHDRRAEPRRAARSGRPAPALRGGHRPVHGHGSARAGRTRPRSTRSRWPPRSATPRCWPECTGPSPAR